MFVGPSEDHGEGFGQEPLASQLVLHYGQSAQSYFHEAVVGVDQSNHG